MSIPEIGIVQMVVGYLPPLVILLLLIRYSSGLIRPALLAFLRMTVQLLLLGLYLEFVFRWDHPLVNLLWVLVMIVAAGITVVQRSEGTIYFDYLVAIFAIFISATITGSFYLFMLTRFEGFPGARLMIPIIGMLLGNSMTAVIIALREYRSFRRKDQELYDYYLSCGASEHEAALPFMKGFLASALSPFLGSVANMGLVSLPGMMTGQILGGGDPSIAVRYQIMIVLAIFTVAGFSVLFALHMYFYAQAHFRFIPDP